MAFVIPGRLTAVFDLFTATLFLLDCGLPKSDSIIINKIKHKPMHHLEHRSHSATIVIAFTAIAFTATPVRAFTVLQANV